MWLVNKFKKNITNIETQIKNDFWHNFFSSEKNQLPENALVFYRKQWAGKAEHGVDWIFIESISQFYNVVYNSIHFNDYGNPSVESTTKKEKHIDCDEIEKFTIDEMRVFINKCFCLNLSNSDCVDETEFLHWLDMCKNKLEE